MATTSRKCLAASSFFIFALCSAQPATFNVADGDVTALKNAITTANSNGQNDVINLAAGGIYTLTSVDNNFSNGLPILRTDGGHTLTINGNRTTITRSTAGGTPSFRILQVGSGAIVALNGVIISEGRNDESAPAGAVPGGGIHNDHGTLTLLNSTLTNNQVSDSQVSVAIAAGGGVFNDHGTITLQNCTLTGNSVFARSDDGSSAIAEGGALYNNDGIVTLKNCTISGNIASASSGSGMFSGNPAASGGGFFNVGSASGNGAITVNSCTFSANPSINGGMFPTPSVGVNNSGSTANFIFGNTILAGTGLSNFQGMIVSNGYNISDDNGAGFLTATGDQINTNPKLGQLLDNGGLTQTHALLPGSPAIDKGKRNAVPSLAVTTDQRGVIRPFDFPGVPPSAGGDSSDIGAFETTDVVQGGPTFNVNTLDDHDDTFCGSADCTLREAIMAANAQAGNDTITFASSLTGSINLNALLPNLTTNISLQGPGANKVTVQRNTGGDYRIFTVTNGTNLGPTVTISGLTIANGIANASNFPGNVGAGIYNDHGTLTINNCNLSNNSAPGAGFAFGAGGAIYNNGTSSGQATLTLTNTTVAENSGAFFGGGLCNDGTTNGMATATLTNCTLSHNEGGNGGAIANLGAANGHTSLAVRNSTFHDNTASFGGALYLDAQNNGNSTLAIRNTILNTGATGANFSVNNGATVTSEGHSISNDAAGGAGGTAPDGFLNGTGDKRSTDPKLDALGLKNNGGPVLTIGLTATSPAINGAVNAPPRDQRGYVRQNAPDVGAFEFGGTIPGTLHNISTRAFVQTGNNVLIGGIIVDGGGPKKVILRALGPTLGQPPFNVPNALSNPTMELRDSTGALLSANDDWGSAANAAAISASGFAPPSSLESAVLTTINPGNYTVVIRGVNNTTGIALVEGYDLDNTAASKFGNISTRSFVGTGANVMIVGVIVQGPDTQTVIIRGLGPTLAQFGVPSVLANPFLDLRNANGAQLMTNDNWRDSQQAQIQATGYAPPNDAESAAVLTLAPGNYTAILSGKNNTTGNGLVEVYGLN